MIVTNTGEMPLNIHGTLCNPEASVKVTDRQWRVFKASVQGQWALSRDLVQLDSKPTAKATQKADKPAVKPAPKAEAKD